MTGDSAAPVARPVPERWLQRRRTAAIAAIALTLPLWLARNVFSDRAFYAATESAQTEEAYQAYMKNGWRSVDAAAAALPRLTFEAAKKARTAPPLRAFLAKHPTSPFAPEAKALLHAQYEQAAEKYQQQAPAGNTRIVTAIQELLRYAEEKGVEAVRIEAQTPSTADIAAVDRHALRTYDGDGKLALPGTWLQAPAVPLGEQVAKQLEAGFATVLPPRLLTFAAVRAAQAKRDEPRIAVKYNVLPSGSFYRFTRDAEQFDFVGLTVTFQTVLFLEGSDPAFQTLIAVALPENFNVRATTVSFRSDVYAAMVNRAFAAAAPQLAGIFFDPSSAAYKRAVAAVGKRQ